MTLNVNDICTDAHLVDKIGSTTKLNAAQPNSETRDRKRADALLDVLDVLASRSPPVADYDLVDPTQLRDAVAYRALQIICRDARTVMGDTWDALSSDFAKEYKVAVARNFAVSGGLRGPSGGSFSLERR